MLYVVYVRMNFCFILWPFKKVGSIPFFFLKAKGRVATIQKMSDAAEGKCRKKVIVAAESLQQLFFVCVGVVQVLFLLRS